MSEERKTYFTDSGQLRALVVRTPAGWLVTHWTISLTGGSLHVHSVEVQDSGHQCQPSDFVPPHWKRSELR